MSQAWKPGYSLEDEEFELTRIQDYAKVTIPLPPEGEFDQDTWLDVVKEIHGETNQSL